MIPSYAERLPVTGFLYTIVCRKAASDRLSVLRNNYITFEIHGTKGSIYFNYERRDEL